MPQAALQISDWESVGDLEAARGTDGIGTATAQVTSRLIELISSVRQVRQGIFPGSLGSEPCWEILLQLYRAHLEQHRLNVSRLTARTSLPATTVLRGLETLTEAGLVAKAADPLDRRVVMVELTEHAAARMGLFFARTGTHAVLI